MTVRLEPGDCLDVMPWLAACGEEFDAICTDPPYHLTSTVKRFGSATAAPAQHGTDGAYARASRGFMGKQWDGGDVAFQVDTWRAAFDLLKPGGWLAAFGGTRTSHRMTCAIEDAGFEIRDSLAWVYSTGFPKSHDVSKAIDKAAGATRTGGARAWSGGQRHGGICKSDPRDGTAERTIYDTPATPEAATWQGWGSALKPAFEPIILARKPLAGTLAANVLAHGCGALNIDACRVPASGRPSIVKHTGPDLPGHAILGAGMSGGSHADGTTDQGRWPANVLHDGSAEVLEAFARFGESRSGTDDGSRGTGGIWSPSSGVPCGPQYGDSGTPARFFYSAKATKADRAGSGHPTVKPLALLRWLLTLTVRPGGRVLDPFAGSGTTLQAAAELGLDCVGIEREPEYQADILRRLAALDSDMEAMCA